MSWDLMYDVEDFKLITPGWHVVKVKSATIKPTDREKNPDTLNDKNFIVDMEVKEGSEDDGASVTKYFAHKAKNDFTIKQLGALLVCAGVLTPDKIKGPEFFDSPAFETNFQMKLPEKLVGIYVTHRAGDKKRDDGSTMYFADVKKFRTVKDAMAEMKKNGGVSDGQQKPTATGTGTANPQPQTGSPAPAPDTDAWTNPTVCESCGESGVDVQRIDNLSLCVSCESLYLYDQSQEVNDGNNGR